MNETWRPNTSVTYNVWLDCPRCGLPWPRPVFKRQNGILVCPECYDQQCNSDYKKVTTLSDNEHPTASWELD